MVEINLLPQQYRKQSQPSVWKYATWALLPITAAALLIPWVMTSTKTSDLQRQIDAVQGDIDALTAQKQEHDRLVARQKDLEQVTTIAQTLRDQKTYWSNDLAAFSTQIPAGSGVAIKSLKMTTLTPDALKNLQATGQYTGKNVRRELAITGDASSQQSVINFLNTFENSPNFGLKFQSLQHDKQKDTYSFTANVGVVGATPAAQAGTGTTTVTPAGSGAVTPAPAAAPAASAPAPSPTGGNR